MEFSLFQEFAELKWYTWVFMAVALLVVLALVALITRRKAISTVPHLNARTLVYGALCVAMSFVLSYVKLFSMPQGGSITMASILPICLYAYWFGLGPGIAAGAVYGVLQFIQEPIIVHWIQPILDYLLAFACLGLAGMWKKTPAAGDSAGGAWPRVLYNDFRRGFLQRIRVGRLECMAVFRGI